MTSNARWASQSHCIATPSRQPVTIYAAGVKRGVAQIDPALSIHDLHEHDRFVSFDLVRPDGFDISDEELLELVTRIVHLSAGPTSHASSRLIRALARPTVQQSSCSPAPLVR